MVLDPSWDDTEIDLLLRREPVPTRTKSAQSSKRWRMGVKPQRTRDASKDAPLPGYKPRVLPEKPWWASARRLQAAGLRQFEIAEQLGVTRGAVRYALDEAFRERAKIRWNKVWHTKVDKVARAAHRKTIPRDAKRAAARAEALSRYRASGGSYESHLRHLDCL